jgi:hypothetical protein
MGEAEDIPGDLKILCVFCNATWTAEMKTSLECWSENGYSLGDIPDGTATFEIACSNCKRIVYRKEQRYLDDDS